MKTETIVFLVILIALGWAYRIMSIKIMRVLHSKGYQPFNAVSYMFFRNLGELFKLSKVIREETDPKKKSSYQLLLWGSVLIIVLVAIMALMIIGGSGILAQYQ